jgi:1-acyl-sn-glycerol-3-phosphate acyltransferase
LKLEIGHAMSDSEVLQIDIKKVIASKNPTLAKWLPGFIMSYIKRVLHQEEINAFLKRAHHLHDYDFVKAVLDLFSIQYIVHGIENVPKEGRFLFASNHPQGAIDSMCFIDAVHEHMGDCRFVVNDVLLTLKNFDPIFLPVNHFGGQNKENARLFDEAFKSNLQILYYPAGFVSRKIKGKVQDIDWKKSFINLAIKYERSIVPVFIDTQNSAFFYRLSKIRTALGIKANIEMFYLADEMFKQTGKTLHLYFGKPISYTTLTENKNSAELAREIQRITYRLKSM